MTRSPHALFRLEGEIDRAEWFVYFFDERTKGQNLEPFGIPFPNLLPQMTPADWVVNQVKKFRRHSEVREKVRLSVVHLFRTKGPLDEMRDRGRVFGNLMEVAGRLDLSEVSPVLRGWVRDDSLSQETFEVNGHAIPLRRKLWSLLKAWHETEGLEHMLRRDLRRVELEVGPLCFGELGRLEPASAIELIPQLLRWPQPYWRQALLTLIVESLTPQEAVHIRFQQAWEQCFRDFFQEMDLWRFIEAPDSPEDLPLATDVEAGMGMDLAGEESWFPTGPLARVLREGGIEVKRRQQFLSLWVDGRPRIHIDLEADLEESSRAVGAELLDIFRSNGKIDGFLSRIKGRIGQGGSRRFPGLAVVRARAKSAGD
ncbi:MAG: hypothetical protein K0U98_07920 [Deltaproteobacteria bacterium]|nr:hypothetical protein [Deltaproteobacteria bacterium]